jgi:hypothetical protein
MTDLNLFAGTAQLYVYAHECRKLSGFFNPSYKYVISGFVSEARKTFLKRHLKLPDSGPDPQTILSPGFILVFYSSPLCALFLIHSLFFLGHFIYLTFVSLVF